MHAYQLTYSVFRLPLFCFQTKHEMKHPTAAEAVGFFFLGGEVHLLCPRHTLFKNEIPILKDVMRFAVMCRSNDGKIPCAHHEIFMNLRNVGTVF